MEVGSDTRAREETIARTGKLMLQGWAMMNLMCPICNSALLTLKKTGEIQCPGCEMPVKFEGSANAGSSIPPTSTSSPNTTRNNMSPLKSPPTFSHHNDSPKKSDYVANEMESSAHPFQSFEEMKKEYDATSQRRQDVSSLLGDRMLSGWAMLGINCENTDCGTPLMKKPRSEEMECVSCGGAYMESKGEILTIKSGKTSIRRDKRSNSVTEYSPEIVAERDYQDQQQPEYSSSSSSSGSEGRQDILDVNDAPTLDFSMSKEGDPSSMIAQKLLVGWALLDEVSPHSNAPLMRDMEGAKHCVVFENGKWKWKLSDGNDVADPPKPPAGPAHGGSVDDYDDEGDEEAFRDYAKKRFAAAMTGADTKDVPRPPSSSQSTTKAQSTTTTSMPTTTATAAPVSDSTQQVNSDKAVGGDDSAILSILKKKMMASADALQKCDHVEDSTSLAALILKLALAAKAVTDLELS